MCGIVGYVKTGGKDLKIIKRMADVINYRGPDDEGYFINDYVAFGHKRLSIIDLSSGHQPMYNENQKITVIFNGEIYNYEYLKGLLKNHTFKTKSDTEVLVHGYEEWGVDLPKYLRGMFSFAIWDDDKKLLFLSRDGFGIKPLYYYLNNNTFMFASEIKALLVHPDFNKQFNKDVLDLYLKYSFNPSNETFFKGVFELESGTSLIYNDGKIEKIKYFDKLYKKEKKFEIDELKNVIDSSIQKHLISDVPVGSFLSSGIDSSYIVATAKPEKTFTIAYDECLYDESLYTRKFSKNLNIENICKKVSKKQYFNAVPKVMYYLDEPLSDPSVISLYYLCKIASDEYKVILSGEGADELFGGYNTYLKCNNLYSLILASLRNILAKICKNLPCFKGKNFIVRNGSKIEDYYVGVNEIFDNSEINKLLSFKPKKDLLKISRDILKDYKNDNDLTKKQAIDINLWLQKDILKKADRMSAANSLEVRVPYLDKKIFDVAKNMNEEEKVSKINTKLTFRQITKNKLDNFVSEKHKLGFPVPLREWIKEDVYFEQIKKTFSKLYVIAFFKKSELLKLLKKAKTDKNSYRKVWCIYSFLIWYEVYFKEKTFDE